MKLRRVLELLILPAAMMLAMAIPFVAWGDRLPDDVAAHWAFDGTPDRGDDPVVMFLIFSGLVGAAWAAVVAVVKRGMVGGTDARALVAGLYWFGTFLAGLFVLGLSKSLDATGWEQAGTLPAWQPFALIAAALPAAALGWWLAEGHDVARRHVDGRTVEPLLGRPGERLVWSGHATNFKLLVVLIVPFVAIALLALTQEGAWGLALALGVVMVVAAIVMVRATATVGPFGVRVHLGPFRWPGKRIPLEQITGVTVEHIVPLAYGGWGWRFRPGAQAFIVRAGPGLRIVRHTGMDVVVTVDDADRGASVLAGYLETAGKTGA